jgi:AH receptor-interacting protein
LLKAFSSFAFQISREKPREEEWNKLNKEKLTILLNYAQCKILLKDYCVALDHLNEILSYEADNVKALYRRAKTNRLLYNYDKAKDDLNRVSALDATMKNLCLRDARDIDIEIKKQNEKDREMFKGKLF